MAGRMAYVRFEGSDRQSEVSGWITGAACVDVMR